MKVKKIVLFIAFYWIFCIFVMADANPDQEQTTVGIVRVIIRFAKIRSLPAADGKIIKQVGYGTMLQVLAKKNEYYQVDALNAPASSKQIWYILQSEVEPTAKQPLSPLRENRLIRFEPLQPVAGQPVLFTALNFHTPNLLKWDMGDGTVLTSGSKSSQVTEARLSYAYAAAGTYLVKAYDDSGNLNLLPLTVQVAVISSPRSLHISPENLLANHPLTITAVNFSTPENIYWDLGDGGVIKPGDKIGIIKPYFMISHIYSAAGTYTIKAWDDKGNKSLPFIALTVKVAADPALIKSDPEKAKIVANNPSPLQNTSTVEIVKSGDGKFITTIPEPAKIKKFQLIKIGPYAGYFQPRFSNDKSLYDLFTNIYGKGNAIYGGKLGVHIWQGFYFWFCASQYKVIGKTTFTEDRTTLTLTPLNFLLRYTVGLGFFNPYAGIGYTYLHFKEESNNPTVTGNGSNLGLEGGFELKMNRHFLLDIGMRYEQIKVSPTDFEIDLGGLQAGISMLVSF